MQESVLNLAKCFLICKYILTKEYMKKKEFHTWKERIKRIDFTKPYFFVILANQPHQQQNSAPGQSASTQRPDLIGEADNQTDNQKQKKSSLTNGGLRRVSKDENLHLLNGIKNMAQGNGGLNLSMTQGALDIEKVMASVAGGGHTSNVIGETSDDNEDDDGASTAIDIGEAATIRRQLDGLEGMYGEVLKLLGLRKFGREANVPGSGKSNGHGGNGPG